MARQQTDMCSKLVKESYKKAFQRNALHGTYELGRLAAELKVIPFWSFDLLTQAILLLHRSLKVR